MAPVTRGQSCDNTRIPAVGVMSFKPVNDGLNNRNDIYDKRDKKIVKKVFLQLRTRKPVVVCNRIPEEMVRKLLKVSKRYGEKSPSHFAKENGANHPHRSTPIVRCRISSKIKKSQPESIRSEIKELLSGRRRRCLESDLSDGERAWRMCHKKPRFDKFPDPDERISLRVSELYGLSGLLNNNDETAKRVENEETFHPDQLLSDQPLPDMPSLDFEAEKERIMRGNLIPGDVLDFNGSFEPDIHSSELEDNDETITPESTTWMTHNRELVEYGEDFIQEYYREDNQDEEEITFVQKPREKTADVFQTKFGFGII